MRHSWQHMLAVTVLALLFGGTDRAHADLFREAGRGLGIAGFDIQAQNNPYSGGVDAFIGRRFFNSSQDFGPWDLTLNGPLALELTTASRGFRQIDLSFSTSVGNGAAAQPLSYVLNADTGGSAASIEGTLFLDAQFSLNALGYYDIELQYSSRQDVTQEGRFAGETQENDFDLGPVSISGNIFADLLAVVTKPIFDASGTTNPFESFAESVRFKRPADVVAEAALGRLAMGTALDSDVDPAATQISPLRSMVSFPGSDFGAAGALAGSPELRQGSIVPEPTVVLLLLLGTPYVLRRRSRLE